MYRSVLALVVCFSCWLLLPQSPEAASLQANDEAIVDLLQGLASGNCAERWRALQSYWAARRYRFQALQQKARTVGEPIKTRLVLFIDFLESDAKAKSRVGAWEKELGKITRIRDNARRSAEQERMSRRLLGVINDPKEHFNVRLIAGSFNARLVVMVARALSATAPWAEEMPKLLQSGDPQVRLVGAWVLAGGRLLEAQAPEKGVVIPELIGGLRGKTFAERYLSQEALVQLSNVPAEELCVDPTDPSEVRVEGIRRWETWWAENKGKIAHERIRQHY